MQTKSILIALGKIAFIALAFFLILKKVDLKDITSVLARTDLSYFTLALITSNASTIFSSLRSKRYLKHYGLEITTKFAICYYYIGMFFNVLLPGGIGGDAYKVIILSQSSQFPKLKGARVILYERVSGFFALCALGFAIFYCTHFSFDSLLWWANTILFTLLLPFYLLGNRYILRDQNKIALVVAPLSFAVQLLQLLVFYFLIRSLNLSNLTLELEWDLVFLLVVASIISILPITFGSVGLREFTMVLGLSYLGFEQDIIEYGVSLAFLNFIIYLLTAVVGLPILYGFSKHKLFSK